MIARMTTAQGSQDKLEAGIRGIREGAPTIRKMDGCLGATYLVDRKSGRHLGITLWESEEKLRASEATINQMRAQISQEAGAPGALHGCEG